MAAVKKIDNEGLLNAAYELVRREGIAALSARKLASEASCSTQPIYENFSGMSKVVEITVQRMNEAFSELAKKTSEQECAEYSKKAIAVCEYAEKEKALFRYFVVDNSKGMRLLSNKWGAEWLRSAYEVSDDKIEKIDTAMNNYILGKAFLTNSGYEKFDTEKITQEINEYLEYLVKKA